MSTPKAPRKSAASKRAAAQIDEMNDDDLFKKPRAKSAKTGEKAPRAPRKKAVKTPVDSFEELNEEDLTKFETKCLVTEEKAAPTIKKVRKPAAPRKRKAPIVDDETIMSPTIPTPSPVQPDLYGELDDEQKARMLAASNKKTKARLKRELAKKIAEKEAKMIKNGPADTVWKCELPVKRNTVPNKNVMVHDKMSDDPVIRRRQCKFCFKSFQGKDKLKRHMNSHSDKIEAMCKMCDAPMKYSYNVRNHLEKCFQATIQEKEDIIVRDNFPEFVQQLDTFVKKPLAKMPDLPPGYHMDERGMVHGYNPNLRVNLNKMIPGFNLVDPQAENSDESDFDDK